MKHQKLNAIVSSPEAEKYRKGLLTGMLTPACKHCPVRVVCKITELEQTVTDYLKANDYVI
jgi:hypothetical protein